MNIIEILTPLLTSAQSENYADLLNLIISLCESNNRSKAFPLIMKTAVLDFKLIEKNLSEIILIIESYLDTTDSHNLTQNCFKILSYLCI